jgi:hypothetical protein
MFGIRATNKSPGGPDLRQRRQHRLHDPCLFSDPSQDGLIGSRPMTGGSTDDADGADGIFGTRAHPVRPSRENMISMPSARRKVCARLSRTGKGPRIFCPWCAARDVGASTLRTQAQEVGCASPTCLSSDSRCAFEARVRYTGSVLSAEITLGAGCCADCFRIE